LSPDVPVTTPEPDKSQTGLMREPCLAASLDENRRAELRRDFIAFHEQFPTPLGICVPHDYWVAHGIRR
jgi:hypothetical protein